MQAKINVQHFRLIKIKQWIDENDPGAQLIPFSGVFEQKVIKMIYFILFLQLDNQSAFGFINLV